MHRPRVLARWAALALLAAHSPQAGPGRAQPAATFPARDTFRALQLAAQTCGRDNSAGSCDQARRSADGLLDHPRLPARCKDSLWEISQRATVAPANSLERREALNRSADDLMAFCRQQQRPPTASPSQGPAPGGGGGRSGGGGQPAPAAPPGMGSGGLL